MNEHMTPGMYYIVDNDGLFYGGSANGWLSHPKHANTYSDSGAALSVIECMSDYNKQIHRPKAVCR